MKPLFLLIFIFAVTSNVALATSQLVFIVNSGNPVNTLTPREIREYYFKIKRQWPSGEDVRFVDRGPDTEVRRVFLSSILQKTASEAETYWIGQKLYTGNNAPLQQASEALTIQFVSTLKGAIGYVSSATYLPRKGIKVIEVETGRED